MGNSLVSRTEEAYDARGRGPNRKFRLKRFHLACLLALRFRHSCGASPHGSVSGARPAGLARTVQPVTFILSAFRMFDPDEMPCAYMKLTFQNGFSTHNQLGIS